MIRLVKNELIKIFHKKAIYVLGIIILLFGCLNVVIAKFVDSIDNLFENDQYYGLIEDSLGNYDLKNPEEAQWYIEDKTSVEVYKIAKEYDVDSWQYTMISNEGYEHILCMNRAEFITKNDEEYAQCKTDYEKFLEDIKSKDWKDYVIEEKKVVEQEIAMYKEQLQYLTDENDKSKIEKDIERLNYVVDGYNYRLKYDTPTNNSQQSLLIDAYVSSAHSYMDYNKDEESYIDRDELLAKRDAEQMFYVAKYKLENGIEAKSLFAANDSVITEFSVPILFVIVAIAMIAGSIVSDEYSKGTIKQLLLRPFSRSKILMSKYIACLIMFVLFLVFYGLVSALTYGLGAGFDTLFDPNVIYNFNTHTAVEMNLIVVIFYQLLALLPEYLIILTVAFFISTVVGSTALAVTVSMLMYVFSSVVNSLIMNFNVKILKYFPTMCWDFSEYLFGGIPSFKYASFWPSVVVCVLTFALLIFLTFVLFKKKNIKNQ